ncbi:hypothetical protein PCANC_00804 [Puccinia coronata f. sp. avenae]|uniref:Uncharacterized protein n=1 Tax=Puccinia coronata f. sp. avenae TaxID=200324 RepID=A0A2N5W7S0_9BASI|nr:hypothetical protein PCANC_00804 [Puccinia coronata f. sp. avenae]
MGGSYVLAELDRTELKRQFAADQVKRYFPRGGVSEQNARTAVFDRWSDGTVRPKREPTGRTDLSDRSRLVLCNRSQELIGQACPTRRQVLRSDSACPTTGRTRLFEHRSSSRVRPVNASSAVCRSFRSRNPEHQSDHKHPKNYPKTTRRRGSTPGEDTSSKPPPPPLSTSIPPNLTRTELSVRAATGHYSPPSAAADLVPSRAP